MSAGRLQPRFPSRAAYCFLTKLITSSELGSLLALVMKTQLLECSLLELGIETRMGD